MLRQFRPMFCVALSLSAAGAAPAIAAKADKAFTVGNYPVEASDKNAVAAKDKALADGQQAAFRSLLKRIVPVTSYKQLSRLSKLKATDMVSGVAVRSERNSSTKYIANLDFSFEPQVVRAALSKEGIPFVEVQAPTLTIVPVNQQGNPPDTKGDTGSWRDAWKALDLDHTLTPIKLEDLKSTVHADTIKMLLNKDDNAIRILTGEYKTDLVVLAIVEPDLAAKKMLVTLAGQDAVGPLFLKRSYRIADGDLNYTSELAAIVALGVLEGRWKAVKGSPIAAVDPAQSAQPAWSANTSGPTTSGVGEPVSLVAEFGSLAQWNEIRTQLLDTPGVESLGILSVSARNAEVSLNYPGGIRGLANALGARGLSLTDTSSGWTLRSNY